MRKVLRKVISNKTRMEILFNKTKYPWHIKKLFSSKNIKEQFSLITGKINCQILLVLINILLECKFSKNLNSHVN